MSALRTQNIYLRDTHWRKSANFGSRGFTLLEILVVLVITGLITGVLFESLSQVFDLRLRLGRAINHIERTVLFKNLVRTTIGAVYPEDLRGTNTFSGDIRNMSGLTLSPLNGERGIATRFELDIRDDLDGGGERLIYVDANGLELTLAQWPRGSARFSYWGASGNWRDQWPPPLGEHPQMPDLVRLSITEDGRENTIIVATHTPRFRRARIEDILGGPVGGNQ